MNLNTFVGSGHPPTSTKSNFLGGGSPDPPSLTAPHPQIESPAATEWKLVVIFSPSVLELWHYFLLFASSTDGLLDLNVYV